MKELFDKLNEGQLAAVTATEGYVRIIAGAGSGKTKTLTHRYAYLVKAAGIHPSNVLCVTFTNKAAGEMKKRVRSLIGDGYDNSLITTYHGFCVRVLRDDIHRLFYPRGFSILDEGDQLLRQNPGHGADIWHGWCCYLYLHSGQGQNLLSPGVLDSGADTGDSSGVLQPVRCASGAF